MKAAGQTVRAIQQDITARLKERYLRNPQVAIEVETLSQPGRVCVGSGEVVRDAVTL